MMIKQVDNDLIFGLKNSSHCSFLKLFEIYSQPLYQFAFSYLKSREEAEGVVQEVFIKIWIKRKELKTNTSLKSYIFTIALNSIRKHFNKQTRLNEVKHNILIGFSQDKDGFDDMDDYQLLLNKLNDLIQKMPERRKQIFIKKKLEEKSLKEIAEELSITTKTVEYHITVAMKFLKLEFEKFHIKGIFFFYLFFKVKK